LPPEIDTAAQRASPLAAHHAAAAAGLRLVDAPPLRVADVAMFYGERSGGIRTYLREKSAYAVRSGAFEHHVIVPGRVERHDGGWHELRALRVAASNGYRIPLGVGALKSALRSIGPDVVLLHDPFWGRLGVTELARGLGASVVAVHHGSSALNAAGLPGPYRLYVVAFRALIRSAYARADGVMSFADPGRDSGPAAVMPLRFGVDPAFRPGPARPRRSHVLYAGRIGREKGLGELLEATARSSEPWRLHLAGTGPAGRTLAARARRLDIAERVLFLPWVSDRRRLARLYAEASCVVMPGPHETFGLVCLEAAASGASVVACETAPSAAVAGELVETFAPGDSAGLLAAIERARGRTPNLRTAAALAEAHSWDRAFESELRDLRRVSG
jgi:glycosyltransferase involved in cell wall biosynthesis